MLEQNLYKMYLIRLFEISLLNMFHKGYLSGTTHTCIGQEAIPVALEAFLRKDDIILSNHRCHGHYLARTDDIEGLLLEIQGHPNGICKGRGGSQHLYKNGFLTNGIQGNLFPVAVGMAFKQKQIGKKNIVIIFIGDGTFGEGIVYEGLNLASLLKVPLLIIVENNQYAQSTHYKHNLAGSIAKRAMAFNIQWHEVETNDIDQLSWAFNNSVSSVRYSQEPYMQIIKTYRLAAHSKGDDVRDTSEISTWQQRDPIKLLKNKLSDESYEGAVSMVQERLAIARKRLSNIIDVSQWYDCIPNVLNYEVC